MTTPTVTVLVTIYKRSQFLREAIEGVLQQTYHSYEILVSDDSDSREIRDICAGFEDTGKIRYRTNPSNLGVAMNVKAALAESRGRYIAILNDDDVWEPRYLEQMVAALESDERRVLAFCDHWLINADGSLDKAATEVNTKTYARDRLSEGEVFNTIELVLHHNAVPVAMASVFRKDVADRIKLMPEFGGAYDYWMASQLAALGRPFYFIPERLTRYRVHNEMETSRRWDGKSMWLVNIFQELLASEAFADYRNILHLELRGAYFQCGKEKLWFDQPKSAIGYFKQAHNHGFAWKPIAGILLANLPKPVRVAMGFTKDEASASC